MHNIQRKDNLSDKAVNTNEEVLTRLEKIENKLTKIEESVFDVTQDLKEESVVQSRIRILRFADEILHKKRHSKEHFD